ncbi:MAG: hypothetical protein JWN62_908 [Acidimicrobiales bacterium]|nr:hypothetical protein [Acidimicrobiales bacterium]
MNGVPRWLLAPAAMVVLFMARADLAAATVPAPPGSDPTATSTSGPEAPAAGPLSGDDESGAPVPAPVAAPSAPLLQIPTGCPTPPIASVVFVGRVVAKDYRVARYQIEQVRAGSPTGYVLGNLIDIRYGNDVQFLDVNQDYLVGAVPQGAELVLTSKVREDKPVLGGNAVIGLTEKAVACPVIEDPVRTFHVDGTEIDASMLKGLSDDKKGIALAFAKPIGAVIAIVLALAAIRWMFAAIFLAARRAANSDRERRSPRRARVS